jgi:hypothetical protein
MLGGAIADGEDQPQTTIRQFDPEPFRDWVDRSEVVTPEDIQIRIASCPGMGGFACLNIASRTLYWPPSYLNNTATFGYRFVFYHELGHLFQLENNDEVQNGYPALDKRCGGQFLGNCAQFFADRYRDCARGGQAADPPTCAFIEEVAG